MLNFTREHVLILGKTELLAFACLIFWDLNRFFMALFLEMPGVFLFW
jgi:hypothetical protein